MLHAKRLAFSLVELSIVLVILGLLVGGVLTGQSLIRAAELRSVTVDINRFTAAVGTFRDKYFALPGDMANATAFWGAADGSTGLTAACRNSETAATSTATCNGNGDGRISNGDYCTTGYERFRAWQHLKNAGMVEGNAAGALYTGNSTASYPCRGAVYGYNTIKSKVPNAGFLLSYDSTAAAGYYNGNQVANRIYFGGNVFFNGDSYLENQGPVITTQEAWNIDTKMDDGKPFNGRLVSDNINGVTGTDCVTGNVITADYDFSKTGIKCSLNYNVGY